MKLDLLITFAIGIIGLLIAIFGVYYSKHSYLLTLKTYEKDKKRTEKAKHYYDTYINIPPTKKISAFLKKIDSDDLNEDVACSSEFTDFIIKNFPDRYFQLISLLKKTSVYFEIKEVNGTHMVECKIKKFGLWQFFYFCLYFLFAMCFTFLGLYNDLIIHKLTYDSPWGTLYTICMAIIGLVAFTILSLFKTTQISEAKRLNDEFKKIQS